MEILKVFLKKIKNFYLTVIAIIYGGSFIYFDYYFVRKIHTDSHNKLCIALVMLFIGALFATGGVSLLQWFMKKWREAKKEVVNKNEFTAFDPKPSKGTSRYQLAVEQERDKND